VTLFLPPLPPKWEAALRDVRARDPKARVAAAQRLALATPEQHDAALDGLHVLCPDTDVRVRAAATAALGELADERSLDALVRALGDTDPTVRELACMSLARIQGERAYAALVSALSSPHAEVRYHLASALGERKQHPEVARHLERILSDHDARVRANAAQACASFTTPIDAALQRALLARLSDTDRHVRGEASIVLAKLGDTRARDALLEALDDADLAFDALDAAPAIRDTRIAAQIALLAQSVLRPRILVAAAGRALCRIDAGDPRGVEALRAALTAWRGDGRTYAVEAAGETRTTALIPVLVQLVARPRGVDPLVLAKSLAQLAPLDPAALSALRELAARDDEVGAFSHEALSRLPTNP
jgi:HEAT repeat protein